MVLRSYITNRNVGVIGVVCGLAAGYLAVLLVGVVEPTTRTDVYLDGWVLVIVAISTAAYVWKKPSEYAAAASGSYALASSMLLVLIVFVVQRVSPLSSGSRIGDVGSFDLLYLLLPAAAVMIALGRLFVRKREEEADP